MDLQLRSERRDDGIVTLWLDSPQRAVVVLDAWLLDQLHLFFDALEDQDAPRGFILASASDRVFVAGADLEEISRLADDELNAYLTEGADAFARISSLPCPTVAVINGAAVGGGLEIAMHCDGLIAARTDPAGRGYKVGLPEASLGLCPGWGGTQMLPARIDPAVAITMAATGSVVAIADAPAGLFDEMVDDPAELHDAAARWIGAHPGPARPTPRCIDEANSKAVTEGLAAVRDSLHDTPSVHAVIEAVEVGLTEGFTAALAAERRLLVSLRHTDRAREKLKAFFARNT